MKFRLFLLMLSMVLITSQFLSLESTSQNYDELEIKNPNVGSSIKPYNVSIDQQENIYSSNQLGRIIKFSTDKQFVWETGGTGPDPGKFRETHGLAVNSTGFVYVTDCLKSNIQIFDTAGIYVSTLSSFGKTPDKLNCPYGLEIDDQNNIYIANKDSNDVHIFNNDGTFLVMPKSGQGISLDRPRDVAIDSLNNIYVVDASDQIYKFDQNGDFIKSWHTGNSDNRGIEVDQSGRIHILSYSASKIQIFDSTGNNLNLIME